MKLYTKEMFLEASKECEVSMIDAEHIMKYIDEYVTPIELPSDDEVCNKAESIAHNYFVMQRNHYQGLEEGAKRMAYWLIEQIKKQADGN